jgi:HAD superfamily hydrolase (TIGR01509 family)
VIDAVVFDMDGVLIDSEPVWERVRRRFVAERGGHWPADAQDRMMGMSTVEWSQYISDDFGVPLTASQVAEAVITAMTAEYREHLPLLPGAIEAVRSLSARFRLAVASSSPKSLIDAVLDTSGLRQAFAATVSSEEVARGKPAPDVYLEAAARLGIAPAAGVAVEDSSNRTRMTFDCLKLGPALGGCSSPETGVVHRAICRRPSEGAPTGNLPGGPSPPSWV